MPACLLCGQDFPNRFVVDGVTRNLQRRKFCLDCSPRGRHNTVNLATFDKNRTERRCPRCQELLPIESFYGRRGSSGNGVYCKTCTNRQTIERQQRLKLQAVQYKGGKCGSCGYDKYIGCLEFHHMDPTKKDFNLAAAHCTSFEKIRSELDKCVLLCANCHREEHARQKGLL